MGAGCPKVFLEGNGHSRPPQRPHDVRVSTHLAVCHHKGHINAHGCPYDWDRQSCTSSSQSRAVSLNGGSPYSRLYALEESEEGPLSGPGNRRKIVGSAQTG